MLKNSEIADALVKRLFRNELNDDETAKAVKKIERAEKQKAKPKQE